MSETECIRHIASGLNYSTQMMSKTVNGKPYILPPWRIYQIVILAIETLSDVEYYNDDFDYKKMIRDKGIKLKKFSSFTPENIKQYKKLSLSRWDEGVCIIFPDPATGKQCRMIAYNDSLNEAECMNIVLHEFAHIVLNHTQQSINGEVEATCFALAMSMFVILEQSFHIGKKIVKTAGKPFLVQRIKDVINRREVI